MNQRKKENPPQKSPLPKTKKIRKISKPLQKLKELSNLPKPPKHNNNHRQSAKKLMKTSVPVVFEKTTIEEIEQLLIAKTSDYDSINYIYVVDKNKKLKGVASIKEVFRAPKDMMIKKAINSRPIKVEPKTDQEKVGLLALKNNLKEIPVVDEKNVFLGIVPSDAIMKILHEEGVENLLRFGGVLVEGTFDSVLEMPLLKSLKHRLPWLLLGIFGGMAAAGVVNSFEEVLSKNLILAAYIPLVVYIADATGAQMEAFMIRDLAINPKLKFLKYISRQAVVTLILGAIISAVIYFLSNMIYNDPQISVILGIAGFCAMFSALLTGTFVPFLFGKMKFDPANASGPIATIIQDILSVTIYFCIASLILL